MPKGANSQIPEGGKARWVYLLIRDRIARGIYPNNTNLPSEQQLAKTYDVSRVTIRRALDSMAADGLIVRRAGSGTRVHMSEDKARPITADFASLMPQLVEMGQTTDVRLLSVVFGDPPELVRKALLLSDSTRVQIATRVRLSEETPFSHLTTYVPENIAAEFSEADLASSPMFELFERSGIQIGNAQQSVSATLAAPDVADALGVSAGSALLSVRRVVRDASNDPIEYLWALYRPDMFRLDMSLNRVGKPGDRYWQPRIGPDTGDSAP